MRIYGGQNGGEMEANLKTIFLVKKMLQELLRSLGFTDYAKVSWFPLSLKVKYCELLNLSFVTHGYGEVVAYTLLIDEVLIPGRVILKLKKIYNYNLI